MQKKKEKVQSEKPLSRFCCIFAPNYSIHLKKLKMKRLFFLISLCLFVVMVFAQQQGFLIAMNGRVSPIIVDGRDWKGVARAAGDLADDIYAR